MSFGGGGSQPQQEPYVPPPNLAPELKMEDEAVTQATDKERRRMAGMFNRSGAASSRAGMFASLFNRPSGGSGKSVLGQ